MAAHRINRSNQQQQPLPRCRSEGTLLDLNPKVKGPVPPPRALLTSDTSSSAGRRKQEVIGGEQEVVALRDYHPGSFTTLRFNRGEHLYVLDTSGADWWFAHNNNEMGYIPAAYVSPLGGGNESSRRSDTVTSLGGVTESSRCGDTVTSLGGVVTESSRCSDTDTPLGGLTGSSHLSDSGMICDSVDSNDWLLGEWAGLSFKDTLPPSPNRNPFLNGGSSLDQSFVSGGSSLDRSIVNRGISLDERVRGGRKSMDLITFDPLPLPHSEGNCDTKAGVSSGPTAPSCGPMQNNTQPDHRDRPFLRSKRSFSLSELSVLQAQSDPVVSPSSSSGVFTGGLDPPPAPDQFGSRAQYRAAWLKHRRLARSCHDLRSLGQSPGPGWGQTQPVETHTVCRLDANGGVVQLPDTHVSVHVPAGHVAHGDHQHIALKALLEPPVELNTDLMSSVSPVLEIKLSNMDTNTFITLEMKVNVSLKRDGPDGDCSAEVVCVRSSSREGPYRPVPNAYVYNDTVQARLERPEPLTYVAVVVRALRAPSSVWAPSVRAPSSVWDPSVRDPSSSVWDPSVRDPSSSVWDPSVRDPSSSVWDPSVRDPSSSVWDPSVRDPSSSVWDPSVRVSSSSVRVPSSSVWDPSSSVRAPSSSVWDPSVRAPSSSVWDPSSVRAPSSSVRDPSVRAPSSSVRDPSVRAPSSSVRAPSSSVWDHVQKTVTLALYGPKHTHPSFKAVVAMFSHDCSPKTLLVNEVGGAGGRAGSAPPPVVLHLWGKHQFVLRTPQDLQLGLYSNMSQYEVRADGGGDGGPGQGGPGDDGRSSRVIRGFQLKLGKVIRHVFLIVCQSDILSDFTLRVQVKDALGCILAQFCVQTPPPPPPPSGQVRSCSHQRRFLRKTEMKDKIMLSPVAASCKYPRYQDRHVTNLKFCRLIKTVKRQHKSATYLLEYKKGDVMALLSEDKITLRGQLWTKEWYVGFYHGSVGLVHVKNVVLLGKVKPVFWSGPDLTSSILLEQIIKPCKFLTYIYASVRTLLMENVSSWRMFAEALGYRDVPLSFFCRAEVDSEPERVACVLEKLKEDCTSCLELKDRRSFQRELMKALLQMDMQGVVSQLLVDCVLLTTAVEVSSRWRELADRLCKVSSLQMEAYEAPHRDHNGTLDSEAMWKPAYDFLVTWAASVGDSYRDVLQELHVGLDRMRNPPTKRWRHLTGTLVMVHCLEPLRCTAFCPDGDDLDLPV